MRFNNTPLLAAALGALFYGAASASAAAASANTPPDIAMFSSLQDTSYNQRKEIYRSLPKNDQINYWVQKFTTFQLNHEDLSEDQHRALDSAVEFVKAQDKTTVGDVEQAMNDAFGFEKAKKLVTTFYLEDEDEEGQETTLEQREGDCDCSVSSDYCDWREECAEGSCGEVADECGFANMFDCNGHCVG